MNKSEFIKENSEYLRDFAHMSRLIGSRADYVQGGGGNTSVKLKNGLMAIKASGYCLSDITEETGYAVMDYCEIQKFYTNNDIYLFEDVEKEGSKAAQAATIKIDDMPSLRPSVEAGFHSLLDTFVIHSHSVYANLAACCTDGREILNRAFADAGYGFCFIPYTNPGALLTFIIRNELNKAEKRPVVLLMENHGLITTAKTANECIALHSDANKRLAKQFGLNGDEFPEALVRKRGDGLFESLTPFLGKELKSGRYTPELLLEKPLYPDQLVFFKDTLFFGKEPEPGTCSLDFKSGIVAYNMGEKKSRIIEETLTAVVFIISTVEKRGLTLRVMGDAAKDFIAGWESEKYRKSLSGKAPQNI